MVKKDFNLSPNVLAKLKIAKDHLDQKSNKPTSWDDVFGIVLNCFEANIAMNKPNRGNTPAPENREILAPKLPTAPAVPKKTLPKIEISLPGASSTPKVPKPALTPEFGDDAIDLGIPTVPKKKPIVIQADMKKMEDLSKKETPETKYILIECAICGAEPIVMPVPKKLVKDASEPVVDVTYCHGNPAHVIVAQLDHDFQVRRQRASWIVFEKDYK
jgi:hypothetical protein